MNRKQRRRSGARFPVRIAGAPEPPMEAQLPEALKERLRTHLLEHPEEYALDKRAFALKKLRETARFIRKEESQA